MAEQSGYQSFWFNRVAPDADPAALLDAVLARTERIDVGVGVIPLDGYPPATLAARLEGGRADDPCVVLGVGSGGARQGALARVSDGIPHLRSAASFKHQSWSERNVREWSRSQHRPPTRPPPLMLTTGEAQAVVLRTPRGERTGSLSVQTYHRVAVRPWRVKDRVHKEMVSHGAWRAGADVPTERCLLGTVLPSRSAVRGFIADDLGAYPEDWLPVLRPLPSTE